MRSIILGIASLAILASPALANDKPPTPAPQPTNVNQNLNANGNWNTNQNKQLQFQGQFQNQTAIGKGGAGGGGGAGGNAAGGNASNTNGNSATINNTTPGSTFANVHSYSDGNPWANPAASAVAPSVYAASICQSAISGAAQTPLFGISFGSVQGLDVCIKMMLAEQAKTEGRPDVGTYFKCQTKEWRDAYKSTGTPCPQDAPKDTAATGQPIVRTAAMSRAECLRAANSNIDQAAYVAAVAQCPAN